VPDTSASIATMHAELRAVLLAAPGISGTLGTGGISQHWPPAPAPAGYFPAITLTEISDVEEVVDQRRLARARVRAQIDLWAYDPELLMSWQGAARAVLNGGAFTPSGWKEMDAELSFVTRNFYQEERLHRRTLDVLVMLEA